MVANLFGPNIVDFALRIVLIVVVSDFLCQYMLKVFYDASEATFENLARSGCPFFSKLHQGQRVVVVHGGSTLQMPYFDVVWRVDTISLVD